MTETLEHKEESNSARSNQPLDGREQLYFTMIWWGVESWSIVKGFKANGYNRKYREARRAMLTGVSVYGIAILLFILVLLLKG
jgi:hypothetical protein